MSDIDPQHIDAVARVVNAPAFRDDDRFPGAMRAMQQDAARRDAAAILDSTDPAVHAAMLDALTRHGVLTRAWSVIGDDDGDEWIVDALWAERDEAEKWTHTHGGHVVGRLHEADWHEVTQ